MTRLLNSNTQALALFLLIILFLFLLPLKFLLAASISSLNPVSHWSFDEVSGVRYDSNTTNHFDLTDNNTVGSAVGILNNAADFIDSNSEFLSLSDNSLLSYSGSQNISYSLWFKADSVTGVNTLLSKWSNNSTHQEYILYTNGNSLVLGVLQAGAEVTKTSISTGVWYHVVITMSSSKAVQLFVNGSFIGSKTSSGSVSGTDSEIRFGQNSNSNYYDGLIDEVTAFDFILNSGQITTLYNSGIPLPYVDIANVTMCIYGTIQNMNNIIGQTCNTVGATTTCEYDFSPTTTPVIISSDDIIFALSVIVFLISFIFIGFVFNPFKQK